MNQQHVYLKNNENENIHQLNISGHSDPSAIFRTCNPWKYLPFSSSIINYVIHESFIFMIFSTFNFLNAQIEWRKILSPGKFKRKWVVWKSNLKKIVNKWWSGFYNVYLNTCLERKKSAKSQLHFDVKKIRASRGYYTFYNEKKIGEIPTTLWCKKNPTSRGYYNFYKKKICYTLPLKNQRFARLLQFLQ